MLEELIEKRLPAVMDIVMEIKNLEREELIGILSVLNSALHSLRIVRARLEA